MKTKGEDLTNFYWQGCPPERNGQGYGAFSVNPADIDRVIAYIANQKEHHSKISFQNEYRTILNRYKVEYDERYVWD